MTDTIVGLFLFALLTLASGAVGYGISFDNSVRSTTYVYAEAHDLRVVKTEGADPALCAKDEVAVFVTGADSKNAVHKWLMCRTVGNSARVYFWPKGETPKDW